MYDRDAIIAAVDLRALADELSGPGAGGRRSSSWRCPNPQHVQTGRTPPVTIFTSRRGEPRWRCHACGAGGTAIDLVMACRGLDIGEALAFLARRVGQPVAPPSWSRPSRRSLPDRRAAEAPPACRDPCPARASSGSPPADLSGVSPPRIGGCPRTSSAPTTLVRTSAPVANRDLTACRAHPAWCSP
jgi:hypothetical protein